MTMYERIRDLRVRKGISQQTLAHLAGYRDRSSIAKIESGVVDLPQSKIILFAQILGVSPAELMGLVDYSVQFEDKDVLSLSPHEKQIIIAYRSHPEMQDAVDCLLEVSSSVTKAKHA